MRKTSMAVIVVLCSLFFLRKPVFAAAADNTVKDQNPIINSGNNLQANGSINTSRLFGTTRFETAKAISEFFNNGKVQNLILSTDNEFADALSSSVLAHELKAPILLVDSSVDSSMEAFDYLIQHLDYSGTVYIIGGTGIIGVEFETKLKDLGFNNIVRIAGIDRYETSYKIADSLNIKDVSSVVISSGLQYPDAVSISSFAANKGWPILLSPFETLPQEAKEYLLAKKPQTVYITGGVGIISENIVSEIHNLLPQAGVERLMGPSRFDTNVVIADTFAPNPSTIYLATGNGFADAIAGSVVAAQNGDPIIFVDPSMPTLPKPVADYFSKLHSNNQYPNLVCFGGSGVISEELLGYSKDLILGTANETSLCYIADITVSVTQNQSFTLPKTVNAKLYNSDDAEVPVKWKPAIVETSKVGTTVYEGVVDGYAKAIKLNLVVNEPLPIAEYTTNFDASQVNRTENIRLAAKALDGKILAPGEKFSFNDSVGERTVQAGYKEAIIIEGNEFTPGLGGGVCQVSSTLYNAVLLAHLEIIERHRHTLPISYVPPGQDATVAFGSLDLKFRNTTSTRLLIRSSVVGNALTFQIYKKDGK